MYDFHDEDSPLAMQYKFGGNASLTFTLIKPGREGVHIPLFVMLCNSKIFQEKK